MAGSRFGGAGESRAATQRGRRPTARPRSPGHGRGPRREGQVDSGASPPRLGQDLVAHTPTAGSARSANLTTRRIGDSVTLGGSPRPTLGGCRALACVATLPALPAAARAPARAHRGGG